MSGTRDDVVRDDADDTEVIRVRQVYIDVSGELLRQVLHMPEGTEFVYAAMCEGDRLRLRVEHPDLPLTDVVRLVTPTVHRQPEVLTWTWNL